MTSTSAIATSLMGQTDVAVGASGSLFVTDQGDNIEDEDPSAAPCNTLSPDDSGYLDKLTSCSAIR